MVNINSKPNIVTIKENISIEHKMQHTDMDNAFWIDVNGKPYNYYKTKNKGVFSIHRNLKDDTFITKQDHLTTNFENNYPRLSINGIDVFMTQYSPYHLSNDGLSGGNKFLGMLERSDIAQKHQKFNNLEKIWGGLRIAGPKIDHNGDYNHFAYFTHYASLDKANIYDNDHLLVQSIDRIDFYNNDYYQSVWDSSRGRYVSSVPDGLSIMNQYKIYYNNTYVVPEKFNQLNGTKTLFKIYSENEDGSNVKDDFSLMKPGTLNIPGMTKNLPLIFERVVSEEKYSNTNAIHIGNITINANTGYNYEKGTIIDDDYESKSQGLLVPYNFKGNYRLNIKEFGLNSAFGNIDLTIVKNFKRPVLDPDEGLVIMEVQNEPDNHLDFIYSIGEKNIKLLKERTPSLRALLNYSEYA